MPASHPPPAAPAPTDRYAESAARKGARPGGPLELIGDARPRQRAAAIRTLCRQRHLNRGVNLCGRLLMPIATLAGAGAPTGRLG